MASSAFVSSFSLPRHLRRQATSAGHRQPAENLALNGRAREVYDALGRDRDLMEAINMEFLRQQMAKPSINSIELVGETPEEVLDLRRNSYTAFELRFLRRWAELLGFDERNGIWTRVAKPD